MSVTSEDRLATLNRLIGEAEEQCIEQTALIVTLVSKGEPVGKAVDDLEKFEDLLAQMRVERAAKQCGPLSN
jgi:hypothetical protein